MKHLEPEKLTGKTPAWFQVWYSQSFWHFKYGVETKLALHDKLLWVILGVIIAAAITNRFF